jgi:diguanylate cyclase (GGDEF)-like protein/PAS domain S-box-containing protein
MNDGPGDLPADVALTPAQQLNQLKTGKQRDRARIVNKALETMPDLVLITDAMPSPATGRRPIIYANPALCKLTGYTETELIGQSPAIFQGPETDPNVVARLSEFLRLSKPVVATLRNYTKTGTPYWVELNIVPVDDGQGVTTHFVSIQRDITEQQAMTLQLADRERAMAAILDTIPETLIDTDKDGKINTVYAGSHQLFGKPLESYVGKPLSCVIPDTVSHALMTSVDQHQKADVEFGIAEQSRFYVARMAGKSPDSEQGPTGYVCALTDISERKREQLKAQYNAEHDSLTGLLNRTGLEKYLNDASAARGRYAAALFIDLDRFKVINDAHGHRTGDAILREVARRIRSAMNRSYVVARIGGDEFIVLMREQPDQVKTIAEAKALAVSIRAFIAAPCWLWGVSYEVDCSIGIAVSEDMPDYRLDLMACSDMAMYAAKKRGGGIQVFENSMHKTAKYYHLIEADLSNALRRGDEGLRLKYQPIVKRDGQAVGYEALIRWQHHDLGAIPPGEFIPVAEQSSLIVELGNWVLKTACDTLARWSESSETRALVLSVNTSALQIQQPSFVDRVLASLQVSGAPPNRLKLEITETLLHYDLQDTIDKMLRLKAAGVQCSLDDFGTGYSSLAYLQRLPLDEVKIDLHFVQTMLHDDNAEAVVKLIINLANTLNLRVVAEGVESSDQLALLETLGCQHFQGYFFSRPGADPYRPRKK